MIHVVGIDGVAKQITKITQNNSTIYTISQKNGISYTVDENHTLVLKFKNVELIYWCDKRQRYRARYMQHLKVQANHFPYKKTKISKIASEDDKMLLFDIATKFLINKRTEPDYNKVNDIIKISVNYIFKKLIYK